MQSLQLGIDYQHYTGFFAYARAMNVDYPQNYEGQSRDVEGSAYVGFHRRRAQWSWTVSMGRYVYPDTDGYDYDEVSASVGFRDRVFYTASYNDEYYVRGNSALNQEISVAFPLPGDFEVGGAVGYFDVSGGGPRDRALAGRCLEARRTHGARLALLRWQLRVAQLFGRSDRRSLRVQRVVRAAALALSKLTNDQKRVVSRCARHGAVPAIRATARQALIEALPAEYVVVAVRIAAMRSASRSGCALHQ